jgi:hypothetical protein
MIPRKRLRRLSRGKTAAHFPDHALEDFVSDWSPHGNESTAVSALDARPVAIFAVISTPGRGEPIPSTKRLDFQANGLGEGAGNEVMAHLNALLSSARSRIGSRLAQIVAIAAASLPAAGA